MLSNNQTANIIETLDPERLGSILRTITTTAKDSYDVSQEAFEIFSQHFCHEDIVSAIEITFSQGSDDGPKFYMAKLSTHQGNETCGRGETVHKALSQLGENIIQDLLVKEFGYNIHGGAHSLLRISHRLSVIACILNDKFVPENKITPKRSSDSEKAHSNA